MPDNFNDDFIFEDISSSSTPVKKESVRKIAENYGNGVSKHLDKVIKAISFIVAIAVFIIFAAIGAVLIKLDKIFTIVALCVFIAGIVVSLIVLFLIYAVGHIVAQNNEILKRL